MFSLLYRHSYNETSRIRFVIIVGFILCVGLVNSEAGIWDILTWVRGILKSSADLQVPISL